MKYHGSVSPVMNLKALVSEVTDHVLKVAVVEGVDGQAIKASFDKVQMVVAGGHPRITLLSADAASAPDVLLDLGQLELCRYGAVSNRISRTCGKRGMGRSSTYRKRTLHNGNCLDMFS